MYYNLVVAIRNFSLHFGLMEIRSDPLDLDVRNFKCRWIMACELLFVTKETWRWCETLEAASGKSNCYRYCTRISVTIVCESKLQQQ